MEHFSGVSNNFVLLGAKQIQATSKTEMNLSYCGSKHSVIKKRQLFYYLTDSVFPWKESVK